jgi:putative flippase GtrA
MSIPYSVSGGSPVLAQFVRYLVVGGTAFIVDFGLFYVLLGVATLHYLVAATLAYLVGLLVNYVLSTAWVFDYRRLQHRGQEFAVFAVIGVVGVGLNGGLIRYFSVSLGANYLQSKLLAAVLILLFNFGARKLLLFTALSRKPSQLAGNNDNLV